MPLVLTPEQTAEQPRPPGTAQRPAQAVQGPQGQMRKQSKEDSHCWDKIWRVAELQNYLQGDTHRGLF